MTYYALVEEWPDRWLAYFRELPGCIALVSEPEDLNHRLRPAVVDHLKWLAQWGLTGSVPADLEVVVAERLPPVRLPDDLAGPLFQADLTPTTPVEIEEALRIASLARAALLSAYNNIPIDSKEIQPAPGEWSAAEHMRHVAESEIWYVSALEPGEGGTRVELPPDPVAALEVSAAHVEAVLRELSEEAHSTVFDRSGAQWTSAKVLRRMVGHLREHYPTITELNPAQPGF